MTNQEKTAQAVNALRYGERVEIGTAMGSAQCSDTRGFLAAEDGVVMCHTTGRETWQKYNGPAVDCQVPYGLGATVRAIARAYAGDWTTDRWAYTSGSNAWVENEQSIDFDKIAERVRQDGEQCDGETVERLYHSLDDENKPAVTAKWLYETLINTQPPIES